MAFTPELFAQKRQYSYHNTSLDNLPSIQAERQLHSAAALLISCGHPDELGVRRKDVRTIYGNDKRPYLLQTQRPLHEGNLELRGSWSFPCLVKRINELVFFWPGSYDGPIANGKRHPNSITGPLRPIALRFPTSDLFQENRKTTPLFCPYNSGSPRWSNNKPSPRGPDTFLPADRFDGGWGKVIEVTFPGSVHLPNSAEYRRGPKEQWEPLLTD